MVSTIFQSEVSVLEAQILAAQQRITLLNEAEGVTGDSLEALKTAIAKVSSLAPTAIANLKSAVLNLFSGGDNSSDDGNQPINPAPQPLSDDGGVSSAIAVIEEPPTGQMCELTSPWYHPPADAAHVESDTACTVDTPEPQPEQLPHVELVPVTHLVAYQRREDGEIICAYLGGNNKNRLKDWGSWLCTQHSVGSGFEVRKALRLTAYNHELKIWGMSLKQIQRLAQEDTTKTPPSRYHAASKPVAERLLNAPEVEGEVDREVEAVLATEAKLELAVEAESQGFQVGDRVEVTSERHGAELLGLTGIVTAATKSGAAVDVNNTLRYFCVDELAAVSTPVSAASLEPTEEEKVAIASIQPPAYNPYPIGRRGAAANWEAYHAAKAVEREQKALAKSAENEPDF